MGSHAVMKVLCLLGSPSPSCHPLERSGKRAKGKKSECKRNSREAPKSSPEKKEKVKAGPDSVLGQLGE